MKNQRIEAFAKGWDAFVNGNATMSLTEYDVIAGYNAAKGCTGNVNDVKERDARAESHLRVTAPLSTRQQVTYDVDGNCWA